MDTPGAQPTVLIAEGDAVIRELLAELLAGEGYRVVTAADGIEALDVASREQPDLILLDAGMPRLDGAGFCRAYRADGDSAPIVLISAGNPAVIAATMEACGAAGYIPKPFDIVQVLETVAEQVGGR